MCNAECGMQNEKKKNSGFYSQFRNPHSEFALPDAPAAFCGNTRGPSSGFLSRPMLFARNALASGPQGCFLEENAIAIVKVDKRKFLPEKIFFLTRN
jgi:hypothetical protein